MFLLNIIQRLELKGFKRNILKEDNKYFNKKLDFMFEQRFKKKSLVVVEQSNITYDYELLERIKQEYIIMNEVAKINEDDNYCFNQKIILEDEINQLNKNKFDDKFLWLRTSLISSITFFIGISINVFKDIKDIYIKSLNATMYGPKELIEKIQIAQNEINKSIQQADNKILNSIIVAIGLITFACVLHQFIIEKNNNHQQKNNNLKIKFNKFCLKVLEDM